MKQLTTVLFIMFYVTIVAQHKHVADRYFKEFNYIKASELYTILYEKGNDSYEVISRLGDSYYNNSKFRLAEKWYKKLASKYSFSGKMKAKHIFRYAQTLKNNDKINMYSLIIMFTS